MNPGSLGPMVTFAIYLGLMVVMALYFYRRTNSQSDFVLSDRSRGSFVAALISNASDFSGWLLLGLHGAMYHPGIGEAWIAVGLVSSIPGSWILFAPRLRV